jgi:hypothetical protein
MFYFHRFHRPICHLGLILLLAIPVVAPGSEPKSKPRLIPRPVPGLPVLSEHIEAAHSPSHPAPRPIDAIPTSKYTASPQPSQARILHIQRASAVAPKPPSTATKPSAPGSSSILIVNPQGQGSPIRVMSKAEAERLIQERSATAAQ